MSGRSSAVERHLAKVDVESSILFARSNLSLYMSGRSSAVERHLAKVDVESSILFARSNLPIVPNLLIIRGLPQNAGSDRVAICPSGHCGRRPVSLASRPNSRKGAID